MLRFFEDENPKNLDTWNMGLSENVEYIPNEIAI